MKKIKHFIWILKAIYLLYQSDRKANKSDKKLIRLLNYELNKIHISLLSKKQQPFNSEINAYLNISDLLKLINQ